MPKIQANGIQLHYEISGEGTPIVFVHEFAGDYRSWEDQVRFFNRRYRTLVYNARGLPPTDVPGDVSDYSQDIATADLAGIIQALDLAPAHVVGLSMGGYASLHIGLRHPELVRSCVVAGCGYGSVVSQREQFQKDVNEVARRFEEEGLEKFGPVYSAGPTRVQLERKDPIAYEKFQRQFIERSALGAANTMRGLQSTRPSVYELEEAMKKSRVPTLILTGDEDEPCLEPGIFMKRTIPTAALITFPNAGHLINLEEPAVFNRIVLDFITEVDAGRWPERDPRSLGASAMLPGEE
ncbi:MAG: alpha/beta hydrolase [Nitrospinota bacterium]